MSYISKAQQIVYNVISSYFEKTKKTLNFTNMTIVYKPYSAQECINIPFDYDGLLHTARLHHDIYVNLIDLLGLFLESAVNLRDNDLHKGIKKGSVSYRDLFIMWDLTHDLSKPREEQEIINRAASKYFAGSGKILDLSDIMVSDKVGNFEIPLVTRICSDNIIGDNTMLCCHVSDDDMRYELINALNENLDTLIGIKNKTYVIKPTGIRFSFNNICLSWYPY